MYLIGKDDKALFGAVPHRLILVTEGKPGEDAVLIGQQKSVYAEVAPNGKASVVVGQRWIGKPQSVVKLENHAF